MKLFQVIFDTNLITLLAENQDSAKQLLLDMDDGFFRKEETLFYQFPEESIECEIEEVDLNESKVIQWESH
jgi:hypothetical protein